RADAAAAGDAPPTDGPPAGEGGDGEIVGGPRNPQQIAAQKRLQQTQAQVDEVVDIMRTNVEKVLERDAKLSELDDRADALQQGASQFEQQAGKLKRKFWLQNLKMMIIMGVIGLVIVGIIAKPFMSDDAAASPPPALQQVHVSAPESVSAPPQHHHTLKSEPTLEKTPLAEKLTDEPPSPQDKVATGQ
ncbi:n-syb, partial [Drosophila busckii]